MNRKKMAGPIALVVVLLIILLIYTLPTQQTEHYTRYTRTGPNARPTPTLVLFRMNGCPSCVNFMPSWNKLKQLSALRENVKIMDFEAEKLPPGANVSNFPTIRLYKSDPIKYPSDFIQYTGDRSVADIVSFVNVNLQY